MLFVDGHLVNFLDLQVFVFGAHSNILMFSCQGIFYKQWSWNATIVVSHVCEETSFFETITRSTVIDLGLHKRNITYYFLFCKSGEKLVATDAAALHVLVGRTFLTLSLIHNNYLDVYKIYHYFLAMKLKYYHNA